MTMMGEQASVTLRNVHADSKADSIVSVPLLTTAGSGARIRRATADEGLVRAGSEE
ncbi:hypothetical protein ACHAXT_005300 [Thalassiosira profunda]